MEVLAVVAAFLFCIVLPVALVVALIVWLVRPRNKPPTPTEAGPVSNSPFIFDEFERLLAKWHAAGQLREETAAELRALIAAERATLDPAARGQPAALAPATPESITAPALPVSEARTPPSLPADASAAPPPGIAVRSLGERFGSALLSMRTRQTVLFLGAFLLLVSALILIVFNWASFPPILQFALLAGVCGGFWAGGAWLIRQTELDRAGMGLQAVGGLLVPVVAFSLSRPGLLDLAPRDGWLLASALCLPIYALAAWRLRRRFFAAAGCVSLASAVLAALSGFDGQWLPLALIITMALLLPLAHWLRPRAPDLVAAPRWVAHVGAPLALLTIVLLAVDGQALLEALAITLWAGAGFYLAALLLDQRAVWSWVAALLAPVALLASLAALDPGAPWWGVAPALLALAYVGLALALDRRAGAHVLPAYVGAGALALLSIAMMLGSPTTGRWALPLLIPGTLALPLAYERGRLAWLTADRGLALATCGLGTAAALLAAWLMALLGLTELGPGERGLALMPLAALYLVGAARWPGRARPAYDLALQIVGVGLALVGAMLAYISGGQFAQLLTALAAIWLFQAIRHRHPLWALFTLGTALASGGSWLLASAVSHPVQDLVILWLSFAALYLIGGALLNRTRWRFWSLPACAWGAIAALLALLWIAGSSLGFAGPQAWHVLALLALAVISALAGALWRADWSGFAVATLLAYATYLAARLGFFTGWQPSDADYGYVLCAITLGLALIGQALRRVERRYAYPYEIVGFTLLTFAPVPAIGDAQHGTIVWAAMLALYALAGWLYGLRWPAALALLALDMTVLQGSAWLVPGGRPAGAGLLLLGLAWLQGLLGLWRSRGAAPNPKFSIANVQPAYAAALVSSAGALAIGSRADDVLAIAAFGLAALLALVSTRHKQLGGAWAALGLLVIGFASLHRVLGTGDLWSMAWGVAEALGLCLVGWLLERLGRANVPSLGIWKRPLADGPLAAGALLTLGLLVSVPGRADLPPLTFALATFAVLLATLAVRREPAYAYGAAAALIAAGLCQLYDWGFREPQWFVIPAGLYLLGLAAGLRRFQSQRQLAQLTEAGAIMLLLGVTFGQSLRADGLEAQVYAAGMCVEALLLLGYGVLARLRAPFLGGVAFFVAGVLWLSVDPLMALNKWVLLGMLGLLLVGVYVLLERRQQELARAGRALIERVNSWS